MTPVVPAPIAEHEPGIRLFSSAADAPRRRRANDILVLCLGAAVLVALVVLQGSDPGPLDRAWAEALSSMAPGILTPVWNAARAMLAIWPLGLVAICLISHGRLALVRDGALAGSLALGLTWVACEVVDVPWPGPAAMRPRGAFDYPLVVLAVSSAVALVLSPHLGRALRRSGLLILAAGTVGSVALAAARPSGALVGLLIGIVSSRAVLVALGSPGGIPTATQIRDSLRDLGIDIDAVVPSEVQVAGAYLVHADDADGRLDIVVCGRDARDAALAATLWRQAWYRPDGRQTTSSRLHQVEQEAFVTLLARSAGIEVPTVVTAGMARTGDAVLVTRPNGGSLADDPTRAVDPVRLWDLLHRLHRAGIVHGALDETTIGTTDGGSPCLVRMAGASTAVSDLARHTDQVQILVTTAHLVGAEGAVAAARTALGDDGLAALLPYLQPAVLPRGTRAPDDDDTLDALADAITGLTGIDKPDLVQLRRVTWGAALQAGLLLLAGYALVVGLGSLDLASVWDEVQGAAIGVLIAALIVAQVPRPLQAISTQGACLTPLPLGPVAALQLAISYVNLAVPSAAGRLAITIRFFQKVGVDRVSAVAIGGIDSAAGFAVQILLLVVIGVTGASDVSLGVLDADIDIGHAVVVIVVALIVVAALVLAFVPRLRAWLREHLAPALTALQVLRRPRNLVQLVGGNLAGQLFFAASLSLCVQAVGGDVSFVDVVMANTLVSLFAGILPVPGGIGVTEAGLTAALSAAGVPQETAFAAVLLYRVWSFYLPPVWGFFAMRWLERRSFL